MLDPNDYIITRKRKKYKFALFANSPLCYEQDEWSQSHADIVEVGAGTGLFGAALAQNEPTKKVVALDVKADRLIKGANRAISESLENITFLRARADQLSDLFHPHSVEKLWITFPDPFPKERSQNRRLTSRGFLEQYAQVLKPDGAIYFKTDAHDLFEWSLEQLVQNGWHIEELSFDLHESNLPAEYMIETTYEKRFREKGLKIYFVKARRYT